MRLFDSFTSWLHYRADTWGFNLAEYVKRWRWRQQARKLKKIDQDEAKIMAVDMSERRRIAFHFNNRYVLGDKYFLDETGQFDRPEDGVGLFGIIAERGNAWMCPHCNRIHASIGMSTWTGLQFPACCGEPQGSRHDKLPPIAQLKRPIGMFGSNGIHYRRLRGEGKE